MRGKKSDDDSLDIDEIHDMLNYLARGDNGVNYRTMSRLYSDYDDNILPKRAASGFLGVRGKRDTLTGLSDAMQNAEV
jgi:hypothetical protein